MAKQPEEEPQSLAFGFVDDLDVWDPDAPTAFPVFDETIETDSFCEACGYVYSGGQPEEGGELKCPKCGVIDSGGPQVTTDDIILDES